MTDTRVVYSISCSWWDDIYKVGHTRNHDLPCCPYCGSMLMEMHNEEEWWSNVKHYENMNNEPDYGNFVEWVRGKCFPDLTIAREEYALRDQV